jgi:hypothetical protein
MTAEGGAGRRCKENVHVRQGGQVLQCYVADNNGKAIVSNGEHGGRKTIRERQGEVSHRRRHGGPGCRADVHNKDHTERKFIGDKMRDNARDTTNTQGKHMERTTTLREYSFIGSDVENSKQGRACR